MKTLPSGIVSLLAAGGAYGRADLFRITMQNNQTLYATSCQVDLQYGVGLYRASLYGAWERGVVMSEASFDLRANDMVLRAMLPATVLFPGTSTPMMTALALGLFDGAVVTVYTAYWAEGEFPNTSRGVETKFAGQIMDFKNAGRSVVEFTVGDYLYLLNLRAPSKIIQASCRHRLYDANCTISNSGSFIEIRTVAAGSFTNLLVLNSASAHAAPWYTDGYVQFTSGQNAGLCFHIKAQLSTTQLQLSGKVPLPLAIGDQFNAYAGCDKTMTTCNSKFSNLINFGGMPFVPSPEQAV